MFVSCGASSVNSSKHLSSRSNNNRKRTAYFSVNCVNTIIGADQNIFAASKYRMKRKRRQSVVGHQTVLLCVRSHWLMCFMPAPNARRKYFRQFPTIAIISFLEIASFLHWSKSFWLDLYHCWWSTKKTFRLNDQTNAELWTRIEYGLPRVSFIGDSRAVRESHCFQNSTSSHSF